MAQLINALRTIHRLITTALRQIPEVEIDPVTIENLEEAIERLKVWHNLISNFIQMVLTHSMAKRRLSHECDYS